MEAPTRGPPPPTQNWPLWLAFGLVGGYVLSVVLLSPPEPLVDRARAEAVAPEPAVTITEKLDKVNEVEQKVEAEKHRKEFAQQPVDHLTDESTVQTKERPPSDTPAASEVQESLEKEPDPEPAVPVLQSTPAPTIKCIDLGICA